MTLQISTSMVKRRQRVTSVVRPLLAASIVGCATAAALIGGYRFNLTSSEPLGLWRIVALDRPAAVGDLIFICPPQTPAMRVARQRGYLRVGLCFGQVAPLIKTVVAVAGQRVEVGVSVSIDGRRVADSKLAQRDANGRLLTPFAGGVVPQGMVFLHSPYQGSYDSRYFGPLPSAGILGLAEQVLTYAP